MAIYSWFTHERIVIFHSYVSLPEGMYLIISNWFPNYIPFDGHKAHGSDFCTAPTPPSAHAAHQVVGDQTGIQGRLLPADIAAQFVHVQIQISEENLVEKRCFSEESLSFSQRWGTGGNKQPLVCLNMGDITICGDDENDYR